MTIVAMETMPIILLFLTILSIMVNFGFWLMIEPQNYHGQNRHCPHRVGLCVIMRDYVGLCRIGHKKSPPFLEGTTNYKNMGKL